MICIKYHSHSLVTPGLIRKKLKIPRNTLSGDSFGTTHERLVLIVQFFSIYRFLAKLCLTVSGSQFPGRNTNSKMLASDTQSGS